MRFAIIVAGLATLTLLSDIWRSASIKKNAAGQFITSSGPPPFTHLMILSFLAYAGFFDIENYWTWWSLAVAINLLFLVIICVLLSRRLIERSDIENSVRVEIFTSCFLLGILLTLHSLVYLAMVGIPKIVAGSSVSHGFEALKFAANGYWPHIFYGLAICQFLFFKNNPKAFASVVVLLLAVIFIPLFLTAYWISLAIGLVVFFSLYTTRNHYVANSPGEGETSSIFILLLIVLPISCGLSLI